MIIRNEIGFNHWMAVQIKKGDATIYRNALASRPDGQNLSLTLFLGVSFGWWIQCRLGNEIKVYLNFEGREEANKKIEELQQNPAALDSLCTTEAA